MASQLQNLIVPTAFGPVMLEQSIRNNAFIASGAIPASSLISSYLASAGQIYTFPTMISPDASGTANVPSGDSSVVATPEILTGRAQKFVKNARNRAFNGNNVAAQLSGTDPVGALATYSAALTNKWRQESLVKQLDGLLTASSGALAANVTKIASESVAGQTSTTKISTNPVSSIIDALGNAWGDQGADGVVLIMHSDVYRAIAKTNTTAFIQPALQNPRFQYFMGYAVYVDDNIGKRAGTTDGNVYTIYAIKAGGVLFGSTPDAVPFELQQAALQGNGAGGEVIVVRDIFAYHVPGTSFTGTPAGDFPTDTELGTASNWTLKQASKAVGIAALICNL